MTESLALTLLLVAWVACVFTLLQLSTAARSRRGAVAWAAALVLAAAAATAHGPGLGIDWLRNEAARSDAIGIAAIAAALATVAGTQVDARVRRERWASVAAITAALCCAVAGTAALALGRSTRSWEFAAMLIGGALLVLVGALAAARRGTSANARVVFGAVAVAGAFQSAASVALLVAWRSLS